MAYKLARYPNSKKSKPPNEMPMEHKPKAKPMMHPKKMKKGFPH